MNINTDIFIIGGGINGAAIAADAAGRGLSVVLCEQNDLGSATSSSSSKLIHGGLRYLENMEFSLVKKALKEREILLNKAPYLVHPLEIVLPHNQYQRPAWQISIGLCIYDFLAGNKTLPKSKRIQLKNDIRGEALRKQFTLGFTFSDCWTDDSRLVIANAKAAADHNALILTRHTVVSTTPDPQHGWLIVIKNQLTQEQQTLHAKTLINATGPWLNHCANTLNLPLNKRLQLVKGSHIVVKRFYQGSHAYLLQNSDGRVVFVIPYLQNYLLIGTTEVKISEMPEHPKPSTEEIDYLCQSVNNHFNRTLDASHIVWQFSGVRPLIDDESNLSKSSREYQFELHHVNNTAPLLHILGGKLTTHRVLAEQAMQQLLPFFPDMGLSWTANARLPGGNIDGAMTQYLHNMCELYPWLEPELVTRYISNYGSNISTLLSGCQNHEDLGVQFSQELYQVELEYLIQHEWAQTVEDVIWRRTKLGLTLDDAALTNLRRWFADALPVLSTSE